MLDLPTIWNKETYQEYINYLISIKEDKYKEFHSKLCFTKYEILGIRLPIIRKIAKKISKIGLLIGIDRDEEAICVAKERLKEFWKKFLNFWKFIF